MGGFHRKADQRKYNREYYEKNKEKLIEEGKERVKARAARNRKYTRNLKKVPCIDCGKTSHPELMHFHHVQEPKLFSVSQGMQRSRENLDAEIAKCVVICSSCHRKRHRQEKEG